MKTVERRDDLRYTQALEFLPGDGKTLYDSYRSRFFTDHLWRSKEKVRFLRKLDKRWLLPAALVLIACLAFVGVRVALRPRIGTLMISLFWVFAYQPFCYLPWAAIIVIVIFQFRSEFKVELDKSELRWGKKKLELTRVAEFQRRCHFKGWPRLLLRAREKGARQPVDLIRLRGALSAHVLEGSLSAFLEENVPAEKPCATGSEPAVQTEDAGTEKPCASVSELSGRDEPRPAGEDAPAPASARKPAAAPRGENGAWGGRDSAFDWSFWRAEGESRLECVARPPYYPRRFLIWSLATLFFCLLGWAISVPFGTVAAVLAGFGFSSLLFLAIPVMMILWLRGYPDRKATVTTVWDESTRQLTVTPRGAEPMAVEGEDVLGIELTESGDRVWLRLQTIRGSTTVFAGVNLEPVLGVRNWLVSCFEGAEVPPDRALRNDFSTAESPGLLS